MVGVETPATGVSPSSKVAAVSPSLPLPLPSVPTGEALPPAAASSAAAPCVVVGEEVSGEEGGLGVGRGGGGVSGSSTSSSSPPLPPPIMFVQSEMLPGGGAGPIRAGSANILTVLQRGGVTSPTGRGGGSCSLVGIETPQAELTKDSKQLQWSTTTPVNKEDDRIEELIGEIKEIFHSMNDGETSPSAYDTAWVAMIPSIADKNKPQFPETLDWILKNQNGDGSWGEPSFYLLYDRLVCTLACILALKTWATGDEQLVRGLQFLWTHVQQLGNETKSLITCGFEIAFPSMLSEARKLGIDLPYDIPCLKEIFKLREKKISRIPLEVMHSVHTTLLYSLEALQEIVQWDKILELQSRDGSFLSSPSSTAAAYMKTGDKNCIKFLTYIVRRFGDHAPCQYPIDLLERIWAVDTIQRLGIDHHFHEEISDTLDYVYRHAGKQGVSWGRDNPVADVDDTCMALRLLRLQGYTISSDILQYFKDKDGNFICFPGETHRGVSDMFNLYRFSQVSFPGEDILKEAKVFVEPYLRNCVEQNQVEDKWSLKKALNKEVDNALKHQWNMSLQRLEAREYINHYGEEDVWIAKTIYWMYNVNNPKYMELAKLDYNSLQSIHRRESNAIMKWWNYSGFHDSFFTEVHPQEIHLSIAATLYEPEFSACRIAYTKCNCIENVLKELFNRHESINDLRIVYQAVQQWNPAIVTSRSLPLLVKLTFMVMYDTLNDIATQASNAQGKNMFPYLHDIRVRQIQDYMKNREVRNNQTDVSLEKHLELDKKEVGIAIRVIPSMFLLGDHLEDHVLQCLDHRSEIHDQLSMYLSLLLEVHTYKNPGSKEATHAMRCIMKDESCTEEEAVDHLKGAMDDIFPELVQEYLKPSHVPQCCRRLMFEHARITNFFFNDHADPDWTRSEIVSKAMEYLFIPV